MKNVVKLWIGITILIILSPLGLLLPKYFNSGEALAKEILADYKLVAKIAKTMKPATE